MSLKVIEKFYSIQGEGSKVGTPSIFVRFMGCTLSCPYCDSQQASRCTESPKYVINTEEEAIAFAEKIATAPKDEYPAGQVVLTGGEPLLKSNLPLLRPFVHHLCWKKDLLVDFETTMLTEYADLKSSNMAKNLRTVVESLSVIVDTEYGSQNETPISHFVVCPKMDSICYPVGTDMEDVFKFYTGLTEEEAWDVADFCEFKLVYYPQVESNVMRFVDTWDRLVPWGNARDYIRVMPMTPIGSEYNREDYVNSCVNTVNFCKTNGLMYTPRVHIDVWGLKVGV